MKMDRKDELLLLIAVSGEIPSDWIGRAVGSESYAAVLLTRLKREEKLNFGVRMVSEVICFEIKLNSIYWFIIGMMCGSIYPEPTPPIT